MFFPKFWPTSLNFGPQPRRLHKFVDIGIVVCCVTQMFGAHLKHEYRILTTLLSWKKEPDVLCWCISPHSDVTRSPPQNFIFYFSGQSLSCGCVVQCCLELSGICTNWISVYVKIYELLIILSTISLIYLIPFCSFNQKCIWIEFYSRNWVNLSENNRPGHSKSTIICECWHAQGYNSYGF